MCVTSVHNPTLELSNEQQSVGRNDHICGPNRYASTGEGMSRMPLRLRQLLAGQHLNVRSKRPFAGSHYAVCGMSGILLARENRCGLMPSTVALRGMCHCQIAGQ